MQLSKNVKKNLKYHIIQLLISGPTFYKTKVLNFSFKAKLKRGCKKWLENHD